MDMTDTVDEGRVSLEKLTRVYIKMRDEKLALEKQAAGIGTDMDTVKAAILDHMKALGAESLRTDAGTLTRTVRKTYTTADWASMGAFVLEHRVPELLEKRIHQGNMKAFLEENPDLLPPGLNSNMEYSVTVRRS
jgi:hypothetical protein